jgi:hypothetical protein
VTVSCDGLMTRISGRAGRTPSAQGSGQAMILFGSAQRTWPEPRLPLPQEPGRCPTAQPPGTRAWHSVSAVRHQIGDLAIRARYLVRVRYWESRSVRVTGRSPRLARPCKIAGNAVTVPECPRCMLTIDPGRVDLSTAETIASGPGSV